jgi:hypothetical protein
MKLIGFIGFMSFGDVVLCFFGVLVMWCFGAVDHAGA